MAWIYFTLGTVILFTCLNLFQRVIAVESKNPQATAIVYNLFAALLSVLIFLGTGAYTKVHLPTNPIAWVVLLFACVMYGLFERARFHIAKVLDAAVFAMIINVSVVVGFVGSLILYSESLNVFKIAGVLCILASLLLVSFKKDTKASRDGILLGVGASVLLGLAWVFDKKGVSFFTADTYSIFVWTIPLIIIFFPYTQVKEVISVLKVSGWKVLVLATLNVVGFLFQLKAMALTEATRVIPIVQTSLLLTVFGGIVFLKERDNIPKKIIAGILAIMGVWFLTS